MKSSKLENPETIAYLKPILDRTALISNPMILTIPHIGKVKARSMALYNIRNGRVEIYFRFEDEKREGEIVRRNGEYFMETMEATQ